jgi:hypothetical protein
MKKKMFYFGKVYDTKILSIEEIKYDIEARLFDYTKVQLDLEIKELSRNELEITLHRAVNEQISPDNMLDQDTWLISGEGYKGFMPKHGLPPRGHVILNACYYVFTEDFVKTYKQNAVHYGGSRVKDVVIDEQPNYLRMVVKYG